MWVRGSDCASSFRAFLSSPAQTGACVPALVPIVITGVMLAIELADMAISPRVEYAMWRYEVTPTDVNLCYVALASLWGMSR